MSNSARGGDAGGRRGAGETATTTHGLRGELVLAQLSALVKQGHHAVRGGYGEAGGVGGPGNGNHLVGAVRRLRDGAHVAELHWRGRLTVLGEEGAGRARWRAAGGVWRTAKGSVQAGAANTGRSVGRCAGGSCRALRLRVRQNGGGEKFLPTFFFSAMPPATCNKSKHPSARTMRLFALGLVVSAPRCPSALQTRCPSAWSPPPLIPSNPPKPFTRPPYPHPSSPALRRSPSRPSTTRPTRTLPAPRPQRRPSCTRSAPVTRARSTTASRTPRARWLPTRAPTTPTRARSTTAARSSSRACARRRAPRRRARPSC